METCGPFLLQRRLWRSLWCKEWMETCGPFLLQRRACGDRCGVRSGWRPVVPSCGVRSGWRPVVPSCGVRSGWRPVVPSCFKDGPVEIAVV
ncbi:hypothetical protein ACOMHN_000129 [Nucella lapillus]